MFWEKLGLLFHVDHNFEWMHTHAALPVAHHLHEDVFRIFFSARDGQNRSHGAFVDIDLNNPGTPLGISSTPVLAPGDPGLFDDRGVSLCCYLNEAGIFYYLGWNVLSTVPFSNYIGALKKKGESFTRVSVVPILDRCGQEPFSCGYPWVLKIDGIYKMWYDTTMCWNRSDMFDYLFILRYAESRDGILWERKFKECMKMGPNERSITRPCVLFEHGVYKMWYSVNTGGRYRIGYAESADGIQWQRKDNETGITVSASGWDSEEIEYPFVFDHKGERYMLYNGNGYGKTGFGLARLVK